MNTSVELIIMEVICNLDLQSISADDVEDPSSQFLLQVAGTSEYLEAKSQLKDYDYVHQCYKYDRDLEFILVAQDSVEKPYLRMVSILPSRKVKSFQPLLHSFFFPVRIQAEDDKNDFLVRVEDISPMDHIRTLSYHDLQILLGSGN